MRKEITKSIRLRKLFEKPCVIYIVGAHDGLGAKLIEKGKQPRASARGIRSQILTV